MSIPTVSELLRRPDHLEKPTPAEIFTPFLPPGEELLWAAYPNAEACQRHHRRETTLVFGGSCVVCAVLAGAGYWSGGFSGWMLGASGLLLLALLVFFAFWHESSLNWTTALA